MQKALSFVYFLFLGRTYGPEGFGQYSFALAFVAVFSVIVDGGLTPVLVRACAQDQTHSRAWLWRILRYKAVVTGATLMVMAGTVLWVSERALAIWPLILVATCAMLMDTINVSVYGVVRGFQQLQFESIGIIASQALVAAAGVIIFFVQPYVGWALGMLVAGSMLHGGIGWYALRRLVHRLPIVSDATHAVPVLRVLVREAIPFVLAGIFARLYSFFDSFYLAMITKAQGYAVVGVYAAANKFAFAFQFIPLTLVASLYPALSHEQDEQKRASLWYAAQRYVLLCAGAIIVLLVTMRTALLGIAGSGFTSGAAALVILAISLPWTFMSYPNGSLLNALHMQRYQTAAMGATVVVNVLANVALASRYGAIGAAAAAFLGNVTLWSVGAYYVHTRVTTLPWRKVARDFFCVSAAVVIAVIVGEVIVPQGLIIAIGVYVLLVRMFGLFLFSEVCELWKTLRHRV